MAAAVVRTGPLLLSLVLDSERPVDSLPSILSLLKQRVKSRETGSEPAGAAIALVRLEKLVRLSLEGPEEVSWTDKLEATWLLTSESFSEAASTSRSMVGFILKLNCIMKSYFAL